MAPKPMAFWPLTVTLNVNDRFEFRFASSFGTPRTCVIPPDTYYSAASFAAAVQAGMQAVDYRWIVSVTGTGRFHFEWPVGDWSLKLGSGVGAGNGIAQAMGFAQTDYEWQQVLDSPYQHQNGWYADRPVLDDQGDKYERSGASSVALDGTLQALTFGTPRAFREIQLTNMPPSKAFIVKEGAALNEALERLWLGAWGRFRWWPDATMPGTYGDYALDEKTLGAFNPSRLYRGKELYSFRLGLRRFV